MKNDPWFSKQLGLDNQEKKPAKKDNEGNTDYQSWTKDQLITEINHLKSEIEQLKSNQTLSNSEKRQRLQKNEQSLKRLESIIGVDNSNTQQPTNNNSLTPLLIGGITALVLGVVVGLLISKRSKKVKR